MSPYFSAYFHLVLSIIWGSVCSSLASSWAYWVSQKQFAISFLLLLTSLMKVHKGRGSVAQHWTRKFIWFSKVGKSKARVTLSFPGSSPTCKSWLTHNLGRPQTYFGTGPKTRESKAFFGVATYQVTCGCMDQDPGLMCVRRLWICSHYRILVVFISYNIILLYSHLAFQISFALLLPNPCN